MAILNQVGYDGNSCALIATELSINGYSDWFQPSFDETALLRTNLYLYGAPYSDGFKVNSYWTSTEYDASHAYRYNIFTGAYDNTHGKSSYYKFRGVRKF